MLRLFFALRPPPVQSEALVQACAPVVVELGGQPVPPQNLHATLCFVGAVPEEQLEPLRAVAARVRVPPVRLTFGAWDYWDKPQILCAIAADDTSARDLSATLGAACVAAGFQPDIKPFRPHLTLARKVRRRVAREQVWPRAVEAMEMRCAEFLLMSSQRGERGSIYSVVDSWPLYAREA